MASRIIFTLALWNLRSLRNDTILVAISLLYARWRFDILQAPHSSLLFGVNALKFAHATDERSITQLEPATYLRSHRV
jgi:hypothetical protein